MSTTKAETIILRHKSYSRRSITANPLVGPNFNFKNIAGIGKPIVEREVLTAKEVADIKRDPEVQAVAISMPLKLIEPVQIPSRISVVSGNTWGIEAIGAHTSPYNGSGIVVAVLDTGINPSHSAFQGVQLIRRNFTQGPDEDVHGHGTHCAATIFGRDVQGLRIGVARGVTKAIIGKVLGPGAGSSASLAAAINWAYENGANVISMSLGIDFPGFVEELVTLGYPIQAATSIALEQYRENINLFSSLSLLLKQSSALSQAAVIIAASGNESNQPHYEIAVSPPAAGDGIISVGALQRDSSGALAVANFSNTQCDLCGPGVEVTSAWIGNNNALHTISGTSMAAPHVAGCAALWAEQQIALTGSLNSENLSAKILASADFISDASFDDVGNGLVRAPQV